MMAFEKSFASNVLSIQSPDSWKTTDWKLQSTKVQRMNLQSRNMEFMKLFPFILQSIKEQFFKTLWLNSKLSISLCWNILLVSAMLKMINRLKFHSSCISNGYLTAKISIYTLMTTGKTKRPKGILTFLFFFPSLKQPRHKTCRCKLTIGIY